MYARPIPEPCNFLEFDVLVTNDADSVTHAAVNAALTAIIPAGGISKYRVSSLVFEPIVSDSSVVVASVVMGITGNEFLFSQANKPLKIRLGKDYGDDGMWIVTDGAALSDTALPGNETTSDELFHLTVPALITDWATNVHFRVAWQDPS